MNDGYTIEDLRDEIGLGANNHPAKCKAASQVMISRLALLAWVKRQKTSTVSKDRNQRIGLTTIPHTFTNDQVNTITDRIFDNGIVLILPSLLSMMTKAAVYLEKFGYTSKGNQGADEMHAVVSSCCKVTNATHGPRNFCHILKDFKRTGKKTRVNLRCNRMEQKQRISKK